MTRLLGVLVWSMLAFVACAGSRTSALPPSALPEGTSAAAAAPGATAGVPPPVATAPSDSGVAALNRRLLGRASPSPAMDDLPLGPGDLIEVSVFEVEELSKLKVRIPLRGGITLPLTGTIVAAGKSAAQLEDEIKARLQEKYMHDPQVSVFVHEHLSQRISVFGAVKTGGVHPLTSGLRLADALGVAGGLTDDADHLVYVIRRIPAGTVARYQASGAPPRTDAPPVPPLPASGVEEIAVSIDLDALTSGNEELNIPLRAGDVIHVPRAGSYYVGGEVVRPGSYFLKSKTTVQQAIVAAGDVRDKADWDDIRLYRVKPDGGKEVLTFSLNEFQDGQAVPEVMKNDVIVVGKSALKTIWFGLLDFIRFGVGASVPIP